MNWYLTSVLLYRGAGSRPTYAVQRCHHLITASNHHGAYDKCVALGNRLATKEWRLRGIGDLLLIYEPLEDGAELLWSEVEMTPIELQREVQERGEMRAFSGGAERERGSGWYIGTVVLNEVHDEGSHGDNTLVWLNSYLFTATDAETALRKCLQTGKEQQDEPGSHTCDGQKAHWEFKGIRDIIPAQNPPGDGALLWSDEFEATASELEGMVPPKADLGVFRWEAEHSRDLPPFSVHRIIRHS